MPPYFRNLMMSEILSAYLRLGFRSTGRGRASHNKLEHSGLGLTVFIPGTVAPSRKAQ